MNKANNEPIISVCIPTYNRPEILKKTLDSIFEQEIPVEDMEVCVSDDSTDMRTFDIVQPYLKKYKNLHYQKIDDIGTMNIIEVLKMGQGKLLKLTNDYSMFLPGSCKKIIELARSNEDQDSLIFFGEGHLRNKEVKIDTKYDVFIKDITYWATWVSSITFWKKDFQKINLELINIEPMFPHTSILFMLPEKHKYIIDGRVHIKEQRLEKKGGYSIPEVFGGIYVDMLETEYERMKISKNTLSLMKKDILNFISDWFLNIKMDRNRYTFSMDGLLSTILKRNGLKGIFYFIRRTQNEYKRRKDRQKKKPVMKS